MPFKVIADVVPEGGGRISVRHEFYGETEREAIAAMHQHASTCERFGPALKAGDVDWETVEIDDDEWPDYES